MRRFAFRAILASAITATALSLSQAAIAAEKVRVGQSIASCFCFLPATIGQKMGIFQKHDLDLEIFVLRGDAQVQQGMTAGSIDIGLGSGPGIGFLAKGVPGKAVAASAGSPGDMALIVPANSPLKSAADLKGKKLGVSSAGSLTFWLVRRIAQGNQWEPNAISTVALGDFDANLASLKSGSVDGFVFGVEAAYALEKDGQGKALMTFDSIVPAFAGHVIFATDAMITSKPAVVRNFLAGWFETIAWMRTHKAEAVKIAAETAKFPEEVMSRTFDTVMPTMSDTGAFDPKAIDVLQQSFVELGILPSAPDMSKLIDPRLLPGAK